MNLEAELAVLILRVFNAVGRTDQIRAEDPRGLLYGADTASPDPDVVIRHPGKNNGNEYRQPAAKKPDAVSVQADPPTWTPSNRTKSREPVRFVWNNHAPQARVCVISNAGLGRENYPTAP